MSMISAVGGASGAWSDVSSSRASAMKDRMFAKVDSDSSGTVDTTELQGMLDHISSTGGPSLGSADELLSKMDSDADGSLSKDELDAGMKSLMPPPSSTVDFAQQRAGGMPPPPPPPAGSEASDGSASTDPLDTNGDGSVSAAERAAGELADLMKELASAMDSDGDAAVSASEIGSFKSQVDSAGGVSVESLSKLLLKAYGEFAANLTQTSTLASAA